MENFKMNNWNEMPEEYSNTPLNQVEDSNNGEVKGYECLRDVLNRAYDQAAKGKGNERHAQDLPFEEQPMQKLIDLYGVGFALGQTGKKAQEAMRLPKDRAILELLGGINYLAGAIISLEKGSNNKT